MQGKEIGMAVGRFKDNAPIIEAHFISYFSICVMVFLSLPGTVNALEMTSLFIMCLSP